MYDNDIKAKVIYDYRNPVVVPSCMGSPRADQMVGTDAERLSELSLRICYDSMGIQPDGTTKKSRSSVDAHKHILEVGHHSVYEHYQFTVQLAGNTGKILPFLFNRPGLWVEFGYWESDIVELPVSVTIPKAGAPCLRLTMNLRTLLDWDKWCKEMEQPHQAKLLGEALTYFLAEKAPNILLHTNCAAECNGIFNSLGLHIRNVKPHYPQEKWASLFIGCSRGVSHELVRHADRTAISQRSTRYCDESASPWVVHPLVSDYNKHNEQKIYLDGSLTEEVRAEYSNTVAHLEKYLVDKKLDKITARKQARGAARGFLGNALYTELIFSASIAQWRHILNMRLSDAADAEIRVLAEQCLHELQLSNYSSYFEDMKLAPASDGIGNVLVGGGHS